MKYLHGFEVPVPENEQLDHEEAWQTSPEPHGQSQCCQEPGNPNRMLLPVHKENQHGLLLPQVRHRGRATHTAQPRGIHRTWPVVEGHQMEESLSQPGVKRDSLTNAVHAQNWVL